MNVDQCDYCLYLDTDEETGETYCSLTLDQDDIEKLSYSRTASCPYFRAGNDYSIVKKQGFN